MSPAPVIRRTAEQLVDELGIASPADIDIEAIAQYCGATVVYQPLGGAEARILGHGERAVITVNSESPRQRQRFSAAHEVGHWMWDRGTIAYICKKANLQSSWTGTDRETLANRFASELLLPQHLFKPLAAKKPITFQTVVELARTFETSLTATALRLVKLGPYPSMVILSDRNGRKWFCGSPEVDGKLWPVKRLSEDSVAYSLLVSNEDSPGPTDVDADTWIDHPDAADYVVREDSRRIGDGCVLTLLWWKEESQILDLV